MTEQTAPQYYSADEIFENIPGDPDNVMMKIPPDICEKQGWKEGDNLKITVEDGVITITKI
jgi:formylmethanofuran dehydrogenase subunit D